MKKISIALAFSSVVLCSCGGSGGGSATETSKIDLNETLSNTVWEKECSPYNKLASEELKDAWNVKIKLSIDSSLESTYRTEYFHPTDTECDAVLFDTLDISKFDIKGKVVSEESIAAYALNETFIYNSEDSGNPGSYTLIYVASEKLYFGHKSGPNLGDTPETRHSSISLDDYFSQVLN